MEWVDAHSAALVQSNKSTHTPRKEEQRKRDRAKAYCCLHTRWSKVHYQLKIYPCFGNKGTRHPFPSPLGQIWLSLESRVQVLSWHAWGMINISWKCPCTTHCMHAIPKWPLDALFPHIRIQARLYVLTHLLNLLTHKHNHTVRVESILSRSLLVHVTAILYADWSGAKWRNVSGMLQFFLAFFSSHKYHLCICWCLFVRGTPSLMFSAQD